MSWDKNDFQGRSKKQYESYGRVITWTIIVGLVTVLIGFIFEIIKHNL